MHGQDFHSRTMNNLKIFVLGGSYVQLKSVKTCCKTPIWQFWTYRAHTVDAYSSCGRTMDLQHLAFTSLRQLERFLRRKAVIWLALLSLYTSIQMKCQGGAIFVHTPSLFHCPKRRLGYARCSLTGNKNTQL